MSCYGSTYYRGMTRAIYLCYETDAEAFVAWLRGRLADAHLPTRTDPGPDDEPTVVVLSERAWCSDGVHSEVQRRRGHGLYCVRRDGYRFLTLAGVDYEDYQTGGADFDRLPVRPEFLSRLRELAAGHPPPPVALPDPTAQEIRNRIDHAYAADPAYWRDADRPLQRRLWQAVIEVAEAELGPDHPTSLAARYEQLRRIRFEDVYDQMQRLIDDQTRVLGASHVDTMVSRHELVHSYHVSHESEDSEILAALMHDEARVFGLHHWRTAATEDAYDFSMR